MRRYALIGGPCCGKSSVIREAERRGILVVPEVARRVISKWGGYPTERTDIEKIQREIFFSQISEEEKIKAGEVALLDRGAIDVLAYSKIQFGGIPFDYSACNLGGRYAGVFLLERAPYEDDGLRIEGGEEGARIMHDRVVEMYEGFGYKLKKIPLIKDFSVAPGKRLDMILKEVEKWPA